jgi:signal transduction histidine kinase
MRRTEKALEFSVRDQGPGLTEEDKLRMFGKYQTLSAKPTGGEVSTGIGLFIANKLVALHKGTLDAVSEGLGKGSTFSGPSPSQGVRGHAVQVSKES